MVSEKVVIRFKDGTISAYIGTFKKANREIFGPNFVEICDDLINIDTVKCIEYVGEEE